MDRRFSKFDSVDDDETLYDDLLEPGPMRLGEEQETMYNQKAYAVYEKLGGNTEDFSYGNLTRGQMETYRQWVEAGKNGDLGGHGFDLTAMQQSLSKGGDGGLESLPQANNGDYVQAYRKWLISLGIEDDHHATLAQEKDYSEDDETPGFSKMNPRKSGKGMKALPAHVYRQTERYPILTQTHPTEHTQRRRAEIKKLAEIFTSRLLAALELGLFIQADSMIYTLESAIHRNLLDGTVYPDFVHATGVKRIPTFRVDSFVRTLKELACSENMSVCVEKDDGKLGFSELTIRDNESQQDLGKVLISRKEEAGGAGRRGIVSLRRKGDEYGHVSKLIGDALSSLNQSPASVETAGQNGRKSLDDNDYVKQAHRPLQNNGHETLSGNGTIHNGPELTYENRPAKKTVNLVPRIDPIGLRID